jgi:hypothetical protein
MLRPSNRNIGYIKTYYGKIFIRLLNNVKESIAK